MRTIVRGLVEISLLILLWPLFAVSLMGLFQDAPMGGLDQDSKAVLFLFVGVIPAVLIADRIGRNLFPPRIHVHGVVRPAAHPTVNIVVVRGGHDEQQSSRVVTVRPERGR